MKTPKAFQAFLKLKRQDERTWEFEYTRIDMAVLEELFEGIELWRQGNFVAAKRIYLSLIKRYPEFIDAHHHLALLHDSLGEKLLAFDLWFDIVNRTTRLFPADFYFGLDLLPWSSLDNRPFLRAYHALGLCYLDFDATDKAFVIFFNLLDLNPNDNQGVRDLAIDSCFQMKRPRDVLRICKLYRRDALEGVLYGRSLALLQLRKTEAAERALMPAIRMYPLIAEELLKTRSVKPRNLDESRVTLGGIDQAYFYRQKNYNHWKSTSGALDLLRKCLDQHQTLASNP